MNDLGEEARGTAIVLSIMNELFDLLNNKHCVEDLRLQEGSKSWKRLLLYFELLSTFKFRTDTKVNCLYNLRVTILSFLNLQRFLNQLYSCEYTLTGHYNQDCLENYFSMIRRECSENGQLRVATFSRTFMSTVYSFFIRRDLPLNKNCENDVFNLVDLQPLNCKNHIDTSSFDLNLDLVGGQIERLNRSFGIGRQANDINLNICSYIAGFVIRKLETRVCRTCILKLSTPVDGQAGLEFIRAKQWEGHQLIRPSDDFVNFVNRSCQTFFDTIDNDLYDQNVRQIVCSKMVTESSFHLIQEFCCRTSILKSSSYVLYFVLIKHHLKQLNQNLTSKYVKTKQVLQRYR